MRRIVKFFRFSLKDKVLLLKIACLLYGNWLGLRLFRFQRLYRFLEKYRQPDTSTVSEQYKVMEKISLWVEELGRLLLGEDSCFPQALTGQLLFNRLGLNPCIQIGVMKEVDGRLRAHAWVIVDGEVVIGGPISQVQKFIPLGDFSSDNL